jgi:MFS family permease
MDDDLQSVPPREDWYEWSLAAFYITYIMFEWMSLLWRLIPAHIYVAGLVLSWGVTASLQAVAVNYPMLIVLRMLLGIGEAGFTGVPVYLSLFFRRHELAFRTAIFISGSPPLFASPVPTSNEIQPRPWQPPSRPLSPG